MIEEGEVDLSLSRSRLSRRKCILYPEDRIKNSWDVVIGM